MPAPRGVPQIEVRFDIDANGIVNVSAKDMATGKEQKITITSSSGLNDADIDRMVKEAEEHRADDEKRRAEIDTKNRAEQLLYNTRKVLDENRDKLDAAEISEADEALGDLEKAIESNDSDRIKTASERVEKGVPQDSRANVQLHQLRRPRRRPNPNQPRQLRRRNRRRIRSHRNLIPPNNPPHPCGRPIVARAVVYGKASHAPFARSPDNSVQLPNL